MQVSVDELSLYACLQIVRLMEEEKLDVFTCLEELFRSLLRLSLARKLLRDTTNALRTNKAPLVLLSGFDNYGLDPFTPC